MQSDARDTTRDRVSDQRGTILIPGLFMGIILVLCCMHIISVAQAILARAIGQNAADAMALEGAVWHAQGMNIIVMINLIMAAVMAVFIAIRVIELTLAVAIVIVSIALVSAIVASFFTAGGSTAVADVLADILNVFIKAEDKAVELERKVSPVIVKILGYAANTERLVAAAMPYVSYARPITNSADLEGRVLSFSLIPSFFDNFISKAPNVPILKGKDGKSYHMFKNKDCELAAAATDEDTKKKKHEKNCRGFEVESSMPARMGTIPQPGFVKDYIKKIDGKLAAKLPNNKKGVLIQASDALSGAVGSLPVQEEDFYQVCARGAEVLGAIFGKLMSPLGMDGPAAEKFGDILAVTFGSFQKLACTPLPKAEELLNDQVTKFVGMACDEEKTAFEKDDKNKGKKWDKKKQDDCEKRQKGAGKKKYEHTDIESIKIARLWGFTAAPANSPFLHVWSMSPIDGRYPKAEPANAMAEFRHVCDGPATDFAKRGCAENSMFSTGWYAKLVPVRSFGEELAANFGEVLAGWLGRAIGKSVTGVIDRLLKGENNKGVEMAQRLLGGTYGTLAAGGKAGNGWWNRRLLSGEIVKFMGVNNWRVLTNEAYPEVLH